MVTLGIADLLGGLRARLLQCGAFSLQRFQRAACLLQRGVDFGGARFHFVQRARVGLGQRLQFGTKAFSALGQSFCRPLEVRPICLLELQAALRLH